MWQKLLEITAPLSQTTRKSCSKLRYLYYKLRLEIIKNYIKMVLRQLRFPQIIDGYYKLR